MLPCFNKQELFILGKYKINIYVLLYIMYILIVFDKNGKKVPDLQKHIKDYINNIYNKYKNNKIYYHIINNDTKIVEVQKTPYYNNMKLICYIDKKEDMINKNSKNNHLLNSTPLNMKKKNNKNIEEDKNKKLLDQKIIIFEKYINYINKINSKCINRYKIILKNKHFFILNNIIEENTKKIKDILKSNNEKIYKMDKINNHIIYVKNELTKLLNSIKTEYKDIIIHSYWNDGTDYCYEDFLEDIEYGDTYNYFLLNLLIDPNKLYSNQDFINKTISILEKQF